MTLSQGIGVFLVAIPLIYIFTMMWQTMGIVSTLQVLGGALAITASIVAGVYLLGGMEQ